MGVGDRMEKGKEVVCFYFLLFFVYAVDFSFSFLFPFLGELLSLASGLDRCRQEKERGRATCGLAMKTVLSIQNELNANL